MPKLRQDAQNIFVIFVFGLIIASTLVFVAFGIGWLYARNAYDAEANTNQYAMQAQEKIAQTCIDVEMAALTECIIEIAKSYGEAERSEAELNAQRDMANWTMLMALVSLAALFITAVGALFVWLTLRQGKSGLEAAIAAAKAANLGNAIARAELRPWVTLRRKVRCQFFCSDLEPGTEALEKFSGRVYLRWKGDLENVGRTPAFGIRTKQKIFFCRTIEEARRSFEGFVDSGDFEWDTQSENTIFAGERLKNRFSECRQLIPICEEERPWMFLFFAVMYRSQENDIRGVEGRMLAISYAQGTYGPWPAKLLEMADHRITR